MLELFNRIPADKARHFVVGALLAFLPALAAAPLVGLVVCAVFALGKEVRDRVTGKGNPEFFDFLWTLAGGAVVALPLWSKSCQTL